MAIFLGILLILVTFALIVYPFYRRLSPAVSKQDERLQELTSRRDISYSMLKELEFDKASGLLTDEDYRDLESRYKKKAINVLKEMDNLEEGNTPEDEIEKQVSRLRQNQPGSAVEDAIETQVRRLRSGQRTGTSPPGKGTGQPPQTRRRFCRECGAAVTPGDKFCEACGAKLDRTEGTI